MKARVLLSLLLFGCGAQTGARQELYAEPEVWIWAEQLGSVLAPAKACVDRHRELGAVIYGVRALRTGELAFLTHGEERGSVVCVHDGKKVVHQAAVTLRPEQLAVAVAVTETESELMTTAANEFTPWRSVREEPSLSGLPVADGDGRAQRVRG